MPPFSLSLGTWSAELPKELLPFAVRDPLSESEITGLQKMCEEASQGSCRVLLTGAWGGRPTDGHGGAREVSHHADSPIALRLQVHVANQRLNVNGYSSTNRTGLEKLSRSDRGVPASPAPSESHVAAFSEAYPGALGILSKSSNSL